MARMLLSAIGKWSNERLHATAPWPNETAVTSLSRASTTRAPHFWFSGGRTREVGNWEGRPGSVVFHRRAPVPSSNAATHAAATKSRTWSSALASTNVPSCSISMDQAMEPFPPRMASMRRVIALRRARVDVASIQATSEGSRGCDGLSQSTGRVDCAEHAATHNPQTTMHTAVKARTIVPIQTWKEEYSPVLCNSVIPMNNPL